MKTVVFDLDGTLAISKEQIDSEMVSLLIKMLSKHNVAIISSYSWKQLTKNVVDAFDPKLKELNNLFLISGSGAGMYQNWSKYGWVPMYQEKLQTTDISKISRVLEDIVRNFSYSDKIWGKQIEVQESQVVFSIIGNNAPQSESTKLDPEHKIRSVVVDNVQKRLPDYDVGVYDSSSVYVSLKGINRKFAIDELMKRAHLSKDDVVYIGTEISKFGKDYCAIEMGLDNIALKDHEDTKDWIRNVLDSGIVIAPKAKKAS